jgi:hypothetical protein
MVPAPLMEFGRLIGIEPCIKVLVLRGRKGIYQSLPDRIAPCALKQCPTIAIFCQTKPRSSETGGMASGVFEYTLRAMEGGPIKPDGNVVMTVVTAQ